MLAGCAARPPAPLRVLTWNIRHAEGIDGRVDLERIASVIRAARPDLVALQEVDQGTLRASCVDQPAELARLTGMEAVFGANLDYQGGQYGNAVLSRLPVLEARNHHLPRLDDGEQRGALEVTVDRGGVPVTILSVHLDHRPPDPERLASVEAIERLIGERPAVLAGDLNATPGSATLEALAHRWSDTAPEEIPTIPAEIPERQIDFILVYPREAWRVVEFEVLDEPLASDHLPALSVIQKR